MNNKKTNEQALNDCHIRSKVNINYDRKFKNKNRRFNFGVFFSIIY